MLGQWPVSACGVEWKGIHHLSFTLHVQSPRGFKALTGVPSIKPFLFLSVCRVCLLQNPGIVQSLPLSTLDSDYMCVLSPKIFKGQRIKCWIIFSGVPHWIVDLLSESSPLGPDTACSAVVASGVISHHWWALSESYAWFHSWGMQLMSGFILRN